MTSGGARMSPSVVSHLPVAVHTAYSSAVVDALQTVFWWAVPITAVAFAVAWFVKEIPLRGGDTPPATPNASPAKVEIVKQRQPVEALVSE
ncbi:hypothetical protein [Fodinicola feengrottensis]|nr:hypothetical protein [Fodinicola feengrottensis]